MSLQTILEKEFQNIQEGLNGKADAIYNKRRIEAFEHYKNLGIPTIKHEDWKYSSLKGLGKYDYTFQNNEVITEEDLKKLPFNKTNVLQLVFVNGHFIKELSSDFLNEKIKVMTLQEAEDEHPEILDKYYGRSLEIDTEGMSALNVALSKDGVFIHVPDNQVLEQPVVLRHIASVKEGNVKSSVHHLVVVGKNSEVKFTEIFQSIGENSSFSNLATEIFVEEDAKVDYYKIQDENDQSYHVGTTEVTQKDRSYFYAATFTVNGGWVRNNLNLRLDGEHIDSHMYGLYIPNKKQHIDNHTIVDHMKPNCESNELYKGILKDESVGVFNGKIFVREDAQKTNAYQNCRNVILSDSATMNSKPQLEIWADDVRCTHGTTTGQLDEDAIFYMRSRGIPKKEAEKLQLLAFAEDVVSQIKSEEIRKELDKLIIKKLQS